MSVPLHLVTGFLGSGKTSFLKHFLDQFSEKGKIAIIQNEFSPVNIDGREIQQNSDYQVLEVNNGSAFCVCLLGSFIKSLATFIDNVKPDVLVMEASGLSDPTAVGQIFQAVQLKGKVYLEHIWCLVDAKNFDRIPALQTRMDKQLRSADSIIVNKIDLAGNISEGILLQVRKINPFANVLSGTYGKVDLNYRNTPVNFFPMGGDEPMDRPDIESTVVRINREIEIESIKRYLKRLGDRTIRCKGFVKLKNGKAAFVQSVFYDIVIQEIASFEGPGELVLIGTFEKNENLQVIFDEYSRNEN